MKPRFFHDIVERPHLELTGRFKHEQPAARVYTAAEIAALDKREPPPDGADRLDLVADAKFREHKGMVLPDITRYKETHRR